MSATVLKRASVEVVAQPAVIQIRAADIQRGYVDVPVATRLKVQTNSHDGYTIDFAHESDFAREVVVSGLGQAVQFGAAGGRVTQPSTGSGVSRRTLDLGFRFVLGPGAREGDYPWPVRVSAAPR